MPNDATPEKTGASENGYDADHHVPPYSLTGPPSHLLV
jgi:hypothetical protein